ncbi:MAG: MgtC/SapB family protein [Gemmataceae bacterium]
MEWHFLLNVTVALLFGIVIGLERQLGQHPAGLRTNALVCLGAALFVSLEKLVDPAANSMRVAAQVVSGIGFLGGGVILREGFNVRGMNTAATLWCSAAVGVLAGFGFIAAAAAGTVGILIVHLALRPLVSRLTPSPAQMLIEVVYRLKVVCKTTEENRIRATVLHQVNTQGHMAVQGLSTKDADQPGCTVIIADIYAREPNDHFLNDIVSRLIVESCVSAASWERTTAPHG